MRSVVLFLVLVSLSACADRSYTPTMPDALSVGTPQTVFAGTTRAREANGTYGFRRSAQMKMLEITVSVPPSHEPGGSEFAYATADPQTQFTMAEQKEFASDTTFQRRLRTYLAKQPPGKRDVTVFVHGYNSTHAEAAFRASQIVQDTKLPGAMVLYSWPSRGRAAGYAYDSDSMLQSRDGLERLLRLINGVNPDNIVLVGHSMGSLLTTEVLRQVDIRDPGWSARTLDAVVLMAPDLDVEVFRSQMLRLTKIPEPFYIVVSEIDPYLKLSGLIRGTGSRERLGNITSIDKIADLPVIVLDLTKFTREAGSWHFPAATSPALVAFFNRSATVANSLGKDRFVLDNVLPVEMPKDQKATEIQLVPVQERDHSPV